MYIVIVKSVKDLDEVPASLKKVHGDFPIECVEGDDLEALQAAYPDKRIMKIEQYHGFKHAMDLIHGDLKPKSKPWWKFWS
jgi:hypothetical protein